MPPRGSPPPQSGGRNQKKAHKWARWLHYPIGRLRRRGAFGARWLLGLIPLTPNSRPEAPWGGGGGSWRPRTLGVAPPGCCRSRLLCCLLRRCRCWLLCSLLRSCRCWLLGRLATLLPLTPLLAAPPLAPGQPLQPVLLTLLLAPSWGPSPQRLSTTHVSAQAKAPNLSLTASKEPSKRQLCPSQFSECPCARDLIPLAVAAAPPGVHIMPSLRYRLPIGKAQRFKCHQSAMQRFSPYLPNALQANESKKRQ